MASLKIGHVYVVHTTLTKPHPKDKITICVSVADNLFVWFTSKPARHGHGQVPCAKGDHEALSRDCFLDLSRVTRFSPAELETTQHRGPISDGLRDRILQALEHGVKTLPPKHARIIQQALSTPLGS